MKRCFYVIKETGLLAETAWSEGDTDERMLARTVKAALLTNEEKTEVVQTDEVPSLLRDAWTIKDGRVVIDEEKAVTVSQSAIRLWRADKIVDAGAQADNLFQEWQLALADGEDGSEELKAYREAKTLRDYLRDLPGQCEGKTTEELTSFLQELGINS